MLYTSKATHETGGRKMSSREESDNAQASFLAYNMESEQGHTFESSGSSCGTASSASSSDAGSAGFSGSFGASLPLSALSALGLGLATWAFQDTPSPMRPQALSCCTAAIAVKAGSATIIC